MLNIYNVMIVKGKSNIDKWLILHKKKSFKIMKEKRSIMERDLSSEFIAVAHRFKRIGMNSMFPEISKGEFFVLKMIHAGCKKSEETNGIFVSHIAKHLKVTPSAVSRMLRGLEERGLIERKVDKDDRRNTYVLLTEKGDEIRQRIEDQMNEFSRDVIASMGQEESEQLLKLLDRLLDTMEAEIKKHVDSCAKKAGENKEDSK